MRCAGRRRRDHRVAGRRAVDAAGARRRHHRPRTSRPRQHGGQHLHAAVGDRPARCSSSTEAYGFERAVARLSRQPGGGHRPEIAGAAARHRLRPARQGIRSIWRPATPARELVDEHRACGGARACPANCLDHATLLDTFGIARAGGDRFAGCCRFRSDRAWRADCSASAVTRRRPAVRRRGGGVRCGRPLGRRHARPTAGRSRRNRWCSPPATSCLTSCKSIGADGFHRAGRSRPDRSRKISGRTAR